MTQADRIRQFVLDQFVAPARAEGRTRVTVRAGDVHQAMGLNNRLPAVCSAIGSIKFGVFAGVTLLNQTGPANGANVYFRFNLSAKPKPGLSRAPRPERVRPPSRVRTMSDLDLGKALVLVSCVKTKRLRSAPARELYISAWFQKARDIVEASGARWFILSALYGLVHPDAEIAPYDYTLNTAGVAERRDWANKVLDKLFPEITGQRCVVFFAGKRYREFLIEPLRRQGVTISVPMANLRSGEQLSWLSGNQ